jgi:hypothetical protein
MNYQVPITIYAGIDFTTTYTFTYDDDNSPINLTDCIICSEIRRFDSSKTYISFEIDYENLTSGIIKLNLSSEETIKLSQGRYYYDILILDSNGSVIKAVTGQVIVKKSITAPFSEEELRIVYPNKFGAIITGDPLGNLNNIDVINVNQIQTYGVVRIGLFNNCDHLTNLITYLDNSSNLNKILNYIKSGGVLWFNTEWFNGFPSRVGCAHEANTNTILSKLGSIIRMNGDSPIVGNMVRSNHPSVSSSEFPLFLYANATALFDYGIEIYGYTGPVFGGGTVTGARTMVYQKIGKGILVASGDVNTYDNSVYQLRPPDELYNSMRALVSYINI